MGQNFSASASASGKFSPMICCFLERKSWRIKLISCSVAPWLMITDDCDEEDDSCPSAFVNGLANARTHKPPNNIPANMPVHTDGFKIVLLEPAHIVHAARLPRNTCHKVPVRRPGFWWFSTRMTYIKNRTCLFYPSQCLKPTHFFAAGVMMFSCSSALP